MVEVLGFGCAKYKSTLSLVLISLAIALPLGCDEPSKSAGPEMTDRQQFDGSATPYVAPALRSALDLNGRFGFREPEAIPGGPPILTSLQAAELVEAFARQFAPYISGALESDHGGPIDFEDLEVSGRPVYMESAYEPLPQNTFMPLQKAAGPYYLFTLAQDGLPTLSVAISAYATDLKLENGELLFPKLSGNEFRVNGINPTTGFGLMITPELAAQTASRSIGALVTSVPVLRSRGLYWSPQLAYWEVELDRPALVESRDQLLKRTFITHDGQVETIRPNLNHSAAFQIPGVSGDGLDWSENRTIRLQHRRPTL